MDEQRLLDLAAARAVGDHPVVIVTATALAANAGVSELSAMTYLADAERRGDADPVVSFIGNLHLASFAIYPRTPQVPASERPLFHS